MVQQLVYLNNKQQPELHAYRKYTGAQFLNISEKVFAAVLHFVLSIHLV